MRILVVCARPPVADGTGDQLRAFQVVSALRRDHEVEVLAAVGAGRLERATGAALSLATGAPLQVGWMLPPRLWRRVRRRALAHDLVLAMTVRAVRGSFPRPLIIDHIDALSLNMARRSTGPEPVPVRMLARLESRLLIRWERRVAGMASAQIVIAHEDADALPPRPAPMVVPNAVDLRLPDPAAGRPRVDVMLTGNMGYPPNADAARWLSEEIAPAVWSRRPATTFAVVGRGADRLRLHPAVEVRSDVPDVRAELRTTTIALAPLRIGTGAANKVLEAMAAGAVVVGTSAALDAFRFGGGSALAADSAEALAAAVIRLLEDPAAAEAVREAGRAELARYSHEAMRERLGAIIARIAPPASATP